MMNYKHRRGNHYQNTNKNRDTIPHQILDNYTRDPDKSTINQSGCF